MKYDYLIVGAGLFGSCFAYEAKRRGKSCLVIDKRNHIGGNIHCENIEGINVHKYGAHIFHTSDEDVWKYINQFTSFNHYINAPIANYKGEIFNLPFNMNTFNKLWGVITPLEAQAKIESQKVLLSEPKNLEEQAISLVGTDIYEKLIKGYTEKQWGRKAAELPSFIIKRIPVRFTYDNNYFNDKYQGIPLGGYNVIIEKMLEEIDVELNADYFKKRDYYDQIAHKIVFTGMIDEFFDYKYGPLEYRSLKFENEVLDTANFQGNAVVNYTDLETAYTRIIEHKHFEFGTQEKTVITKEYPLEYKFGQEPYYPINDDKNKLVLDRYKDLASQKENVIFGGRLDQYTYYDMDKIIIEVLKAVKKEFNP